MSRRTIRFFQHVCVDRPKQNRYMEQNVDSNEPQSLQKSLFPYPAYVVELIARPRMHDTFGLRFL